MVPVHTCSTTYRCTKKCLINLCFNLCAAIARFCEAILDFLADDQRAKDATIKEEDFEGEVFAAFEQLFNVWLLSKEKKVVIFNDD